MFDIGPLDLGYLRYITNMDVFARSTDSLDRVDVQVEYEKVTFFVDKKIDQQQTLTKWTFEPKLKTSALRSKRLK